MSEGFTDRVIALFYGDPGTGKTVDLASMARLGKITYIDAEKRLKAGVLRRLGIPVENIDRRVSVSYAMLEDLVAAALNDARGKADQAAAAEMQKMSAGLPLPPGFKLPF